MLFNFQFCLILSAWICGWALAPPTFESRCPILRGLEKKGLYRRRLADKPNVQTVSETYVCAPGCVAEDAECLYHASVVKIEECYQCCADYGQNPLSSLQHEGSAPQTSTETGDGPILEEEDSGIRVDLM